MRGGQVAQTTKEQAQNVVGEAKQQARDLVGEARTQVRDQAGTQRDRAVQGLHALGDELDQMTQQGGQSGLATEVARQAVRPDPGPGALSRAARAGRPARRAAGLRRRRPVVFLAGAALAGVVAGRLTKGIAAGAPEQDGARSLTARVRLRPADAGRPSASAPYCRRTAYERRATRRPGYQCGPRGYQGPGTKTPDYGTTGGGFRAPDAGGTPYPPTADPDYQPAPDPATSRTRPAYQPDPTLDPQQPPARGWTP